MKFLKGFTNFLEFVVHCSAFGGYSFRSRPKQGLGVQKSSGLSFYFLVRPVPVARH